MLPLTTVAFAVVLGDSAQIPGPGVLAHEILAIVVALGVFLAGTDRRP